MLPISEAVKRYKDSHKMVRPFLDMSVEHEAVGVENIPDKGGFLLVANHRSDMDPLLIGTHVPRFMVWVAASYVFKIPFIGKYLEELGTIPISDDRKEQVAAFRQISHTLKKDRILGIFPEGHDYINENDFSKPLHTFHSGFARFSLKMNKPVLPAAIIGIEEHPETILVPSFVREMLGFPKEVLYTKNRLAYKKTKVVFGEPIDITPFQKMELEKGIAELCEFTKHTIQDLIHNHAPIERRSAEGGRRSGTRVPPEEITQQRSH